MFENFSLTPHGKGRGFLLSKDEASPLEAKRAEGDPVRGGNRAGGSQYQRHFFRQRREFGTNQKATQERAVGLRAFPMEQ
jgi:hypothetical protein